MQFYYTFIKDFTVPEAVNMHIHNCFEMIYYDKAMGVSFWQKANQPALDHLVFASLKNAYSIRALFFTDNTLVLIPPSVFHDEQHKQPFRLTAVGFSPSKNDFMFDLSDLITEPMAIPDQSGEFRKIFSLINSEYKKKSPFYSEIINSLLKRVLQLIFGKDTPTPSNLATIEHAKSYIDEYFTSQVDLDELVRYSHYSADHFRILFTKLTGLPPKQYILEKRFDYAKKLLAETALSLAEISQNCGFNDYVSFHNLFKRKSGMCPKDFRAKIVSTKKEKPSE